MGKGRKRARGYTLQSGPEGPSWCRSRSRSGRSKTTMHQVQGWSAGGDKCWGHKNQRAPATLRASKGGCKLTFVKIHIFRALRGRSPPRLSWPRRPEALFAA